MSGTHTPTSDNSNSSRVRLTRTVAIIKNHALKHRMTIERRIEEAGFEIVKERQMEFDDGGSDQEYLRELFGNDTPSLFEGPVWVYVLERRRAVEVWKALMGEEDPDRARELSPNSLRAVYGADQTQNALMGSPDTETAEVQIQALFQSSPPFPSHDPDELEGANELQQELSNEVGAALNDWQNRDALLSPSSSQLSQSAGFTTTSTESRRPAFTSFVSTSSSKTSPTGKVQFKARPVPKTNETPDISPRMSRAASLRAGVAVAPSRYDRPRVAPTKEEQKQAFMDVPGHKRSTTIQVASTAPPAIAPRMTRAAALRLGQPLPVTPPRPKPTPSKSGGIFEGVPGHKRRETISVASVQAPTVSPRLNKSAELRAKKDTATPPTSFMFRQASAPKTPGSLSRSPSQTGLSTSRPGSALSSTRPGSALSRTTSEASPSRTTPAGRLGSVGRASSKKLLDSAPSIPKNEAVEMPATPTRPPSIEPRLNRSAMLRAKLGGPTPPVKKVPITANRRASMIV